MRIWLFFSFALLAAAPAVHAAELRGVVVAVADGDTVTVLDANDRRHPVRLAGIDAPERAQPFGGRSRASLAALVLRKDVRVLLHKRDRYGRMVGTILLGQEDANLEQVRHGLAMVFPAYAREMPLAERRTYRVAQALAQQERAGLWSDPAPVAPWEFRRSRKGGTPGSLQPLGERS